MESEISDGLTPAPAPTAASLEDAGTRRGFWRAQSGMMARLRKLIVAVIGGTVLLVGLAMVVLPGPAIVVIPAGLAILATEFAWAGHLLRRARKMVARKSRP